MCLADALAAIQNVAKLKTRGSVVLAPPLLRHFGQHVLPASYRHILTGPGVFLMLLDARF